MILLDNNFFIKLKNLEEALPNNILEFQAQIEMLKEVVQELFRLYSEVPQDASCEITGDISELTISEKMKNHMIDTQNGIKEDVEKIYDDLSKNDFNHETILEFKEELFDFLKNY
jgi:uncharacterized protein YPO0396